MFSNKLYAFDYDKKKEFINVEITTSFHLCLILNMYWYISKINSPISSRTNRYISKSHLYPKSLINCPKC